MTMRAQTGFLRARGGTAAIEFGFLAVPFLTLALGVVEVGRACWTLEALQESASQGARCIGVHQSSCYSAGSYSGSSTTTYVRSVASGWGISVPAADITATQSTSCGTVAGFAQIQIAYNFQSVVGGLIPMLANKPLAVSACFPDNP
jgi:Flp pilus assembly protein TadG